jgi:AcrR family transcriptional regulator
MAWSFDKIQAFMDRFLSKGNPTDPKERKRRRILRAATEHFTQHGYRKANMEEIARSAGVAKGTLYLYFKTKSDLLVHAIAQEKHQYMSRMLPILKQEIPARDRLRLWLKEVFVVTNEMPLVSRLMGGDREIFEVLEEMDGDLKEHSIELQHGFLAAYLDSAARPHRWTTTELYERTRVLVALMYAAGVFGDERARQGLSMDRFAELLSSMLVDGVAGPTQEPPIKGASQ